MKPYFIVLFIAGLVLAIQACTPTGAPIASLGRPQFVPQSPPDSIVETGIRQDPNTGGMFLQWYAMPFAAGYKIYRSDTTNLAGTPFQFVLIANVISSIVLEDTSIADLTSIRTGVKYYYCMTAYASDGTSSQPSDTIDYTLLSQTPLSYPVANAIVDPSAFTFGWSNVAGGGGYTVIRVRDISVIPNTTVWVSSRFQTFVQYPSYGFNFDSTATQQLVPGQSYEWRVERFDVDASGRSYEGSTSQWSTFTVK